MGLHPCYHWIRFNHDLYDRLSTSPRIQGARPVGKRAQRVIKLGGFLLGLDFSKHRFEFGGDIRVICVCESDLRESFSLVNWNFPPLTSRQFDPWHLITSFAQYMFMAPSYINVLNVYAVLDFVFSFPFWNLTCLITLVCKRS